MTTPHSRFVVRYSLHPLKQLGLISVLLCSFCLLTACPQPENRPDGNATSHIEPYVYLAEVTETSALIAWGSFEFRGKAVTANEFEINQLVKANIGESTPALAQSQMVKVFRSDGSEIGTFTATTGKNFCWLTGLTPDTEYRYQVVLGEVPFAQGPRFDWVQVGGREKLVSGKEYRFQFRTRPQLDQPSDLNFVVLGDYGKGINQLTGGDRFQGPIAQALEQSMVTYRPRFLLTTGDNIYKGGSNDKDWFLKYFQPYRYIISQIPVYPTVGNHDDGETEDSTDRTVLYDNFLMKERLRNDTTALVDQEAGLFYQIRYGSDIEFVCLDTASHTILNRYPNRKFNLPRGSQFITALTSRPLNQTPRWLIPFFHHPPFCAGPTHASHLNVSTGKGEGDYGSLTKAQFDALIQAGVRVVFSGHEHNFEYAKPANYNLHCIISGAGGALRDGQLNHDSLREASIQSWSNQAHFLIVTIQAPDRGVMEIRVIGANANGTPNKEVPVWKTASSPVPEPMPLKIRL